MKEITGDIWEYWERGYPICITTNGFVKRNGEAVMGRGVALQARKKFPHLPLLLGQMIQSRGWSKIYQLTSKIIAFPVKRDYAQYYRDNVVDHMRDRFISGQYVPGWALKSELVIIEDSLKQLAALRQLWFEVDETIILPRPGCGAGELEWQDVYPLCAAYGDWLHVISRDDF